MHLARLLTITAGACLITSSAALPASAAEIRYVALGDSYSSGTGAGSYDGPCQRSANAYPRLWAAAHDPASFTFAACAGAETTDVAANQLGGLGSGTTHVSISVGGNDAGFSDVMLTCVLRSSSTCENRVETAEDYMRGTLPGRLDSLFDKIDARAPSAHVVVLGYPHLYIKDSSGCWGLTQRKRTALNRASDTLNTAVEKATARSGFTFSDVRDEFDGHELCSGDDWLHSVTYPLGDSYHPTARGHARGYLPAFESTDQTAAKTGSNA